MDYGSEPVRNQQSNGRGVRKSNEAYYGVGGFLWEIGKVIVLALVIIAPIRMFLFQPFFVQGASMEPNFLDGEYLIINELGYKTTRLGSLLTVEPFKSVERGDTIVFRYPKNPGQFFIKRVIGLPGETIQVAEGKVILFNRDHPDGQVMDESDYLDESLRTKGEVTTVLKDREYFVMGDNRSFSFDSRAWGPLPEENIVGKVLLRAWPVGRADVF